MLYLKWNTDTSQTMLNLTYPAYARRKIIFQATFWGEYVSSLECCSFETLVFQIPCEDRFLDPQTPPEKAFWGVSFHTDPHKVWLEDFVEDEGKVSPAFTNFWILELIPASTETPFAGEASTWLQTLAAIHGVQCEISEETWWLKPKR